MKLQQPKDLIELTEKFLADFTVLAEKHDSKVFNKPSKSYIFHNTLMKALMSTEYAKGIEAIPGQLPLGDMNSMPMVLLKESFDMKISGLFTRLKQLLSSLSNIEDGDITISEFVKRKKKYQFRMCNSKWDYACYVEVFYIGADEDISELIVYNDRYSKPSFSIKMDLVIPPMEEIVEAGNITRSEQLDIFNITEYYNMQHFFSTLYDLMIDLKVK